MQEDARPQRRARGEAGQGLVRWSTVDAEGERASIGVPHHPDHCAFCITVRGGLQDLRGILAVRVGGGVIFWKRRVVIDASAVLITAGKHPIERSVFKAESPAVVRLRVADPDGDEALVRQRHVDSHVE